MWPMGLLFLALFAILHSSVKHDVLILLELVEGFSLHSLAIRIKDSVNFWIGSAWLSNSLFKIFFNQRLSNRVQLALLSFQCSVQSFLYARLWRDVLWYSVVRLSVHALHTELLAPGFYNLVHFISMVRRKCLLFLKVRGLRSRSYWHKVRKRSRRDTDWTVSSRILQLGTIVQHDERKMPIVFQG